MSSLFVETQNGEIEAIFIISAGCVIDALLDIRAGRIC